MTAIKSKLSDPSATTWSLSDRPQSLFDHMPVTNRGRRRVGGQARNRRASSSSHVRLRPLLSRAAPSGVVENPMDLAMVPSINDIGHVMGKQTVTEFVENEHILKLPRENVVDYVQCYDMGCRCR